MIATAFAQKGTLASPNNLGQTTSGANAPQAPVITLPVNTGFRILIKSIIIFGSAAGAATLSITDGITVINLGTIVIGTAPQVIAINFLGAIGSNITVNVGAAGAAVTTTVSVTADTVQS